MVEDEFDHLSDPFTGVTEEEWSRVLDQANATSTSSINHQSAHPQQSDTPLPQASPTRSTASTDYGDNSLIDENALVELDRIEASTFHIPRGPSSTAHGTGLSSNSGDHGSNQMTDRTMQSRFFRGNGPTNAQVPSSVTHRNFGNITNEEDGRPSKRSRRELSSSFELQRTLGVDEAVRHVFEGYEEELTCPICCDLFVATHVGNPCGHSYCGDCGWQWLKRNKQNQCPVCRTKLVRSEPLIPNIALDSLMEKHIQQLSSSGDVGWYPQGQKYKERAQRKVKWKTSSEARMKAKQTRKAEIRPIIIDELPQDIVLFLPSDDDSSYVEESGEEGVTVIRRPMRNLRGRRR